MTHTVIFLFVLAMCVTFLICAFRAEDRAWEAERKYDRLRASLAMLELDMKLKFDKSDPDFCAGWNLAMGHIRTMVREIKKHA